MGDSTLQNITKSDYFLFDLTTVVVEALSWKHEFTSISEGETLIFETDSNDGSNFAFEFKLLEYFEFSFDES